MAGSQAFYETFKMGGSEQHFRIRGWLSVFKAWDERWRTSLTLSRALRSNVKGSQLCNGKEALCKANGIVASKTVWKDALEVTSSNGMRNIHFYPRVYSLNMNKMTYCWGFWRTNLSLRVHLSMNKGSGFALMSYQMGLFRHFRSWSCSFGVPMWTFLKQKEDIPWYRKNGQSQ